MADRALATAYVTIVPSFKGFSEEWRKAIPDSSAPGQEQGKKFATGFSKSVGSSIGRQLTAVFAAGSVVNFTKDLIAAGEAEVSSNKKLENVAKSMGLFGDQADKVSKRLEDLSGKQQIALGIDDDTIKSTQMKLLTFANLAKTAGETGGMFDRATIAAQDLAAAGFGSAESNAVQLGKALQDPVKGVTALARSGVTFTDQEKKKIESLVKSNNLLGAQQIVMKAIETQVGGTAAAGVTGSERMKQSFNQFKEQLGLALLPTFNKVSNFISNTLIPALKDFFDRFQKGKTFLNPVVDTITAFVKFLVKNKDFLLPIAAGFATVFAAIKIYNAVMKVAAAVQLAFNIIAAANPFVLLGLVILGVVTAVTLFLTKTKTGKKIFQELKDAFKTAFDFMKGIAETFVNFFITELNMIIHMINAVIRGMNLLPGVNIPTIKTIGKVDFTDDSKPGGGKTPAVNLTPPKAVQGSGPHGATTTVIYNAAPNNSIDGHTALRTAMDRTTGGLK